MVLLLLCSYLSSFAQLINLQLKNVTVKQAIETIQKQNGYSFAFAASDLNTKKIVTVLAKDLPIEKVVEQVLAGQDVSYTIQGKDIIIKKKDSQSVQQSSKKYTISGIVKDMSGEPVIGANIKEKNGTAGTISGMDGKFQLTVNEGSIVQISYLGFLTQEVSVKNKNYLTVMLKDDTQTLDEVVVVGFSTQKKINLTGAVENVSSDVFENRPVANVTQMLQGAVPNLNISLVDGKPN